MVRFLGASAVAVIGLLLLIWLLAVRPSVTFSDKYDKQPCWAVLEPLSSQGDFHGSMPTTSHAPKDSSFDDAELKDMGEDCDRKRTAQVALAALVSPVTVLALFFARRYLRALGAPTASD